MSRYRKLIVILLLVLTGCNAKVELNEVLIVSAVGIDQEGDQMMVHLQVVNAGGITGGQGGASVGSSGSTGGGSVYTYSVAGTTLYEAVEKASNILPRKLLFSHVSCFIVGEKYARKIGLAPLFDYMERNYEIRDNAFILIAKNSSAKDILTLYTPINKNPGELLRRQVELSSSTTGIAKGIKQKDIINWRYGEFRDPVIQGVERVELSKMSGSTSNLTNIDANNKMYHITGLALFDKEHMTGWYNENQTIGWAIINARIKQLFISIKKCDGQKGHIGLMIKNIKSSVKPVVEQEEITYEVNVSGIANLQEVTCKMDISDPNTIIEMEKQVEEHIEHDIESAVQLAKQKKIDVFGFGKSLYDKEPKMWKKQYKKVWKKEFTKVKVTPVVTIQMESVGTRVKTIHEKK
ncbi:Ger(x)C family spore germination protein [Paenibacillus eucommiae]|uniref:Spore germination protein KC n=1 Tax=Paenibacillus eucommiae TaxID=1355755 RepID=A0ABS4IQJ9_9BACL|nr:Ger(x)C family spore germination protein [Paenibacillus eucommiae]MBP1989842.1 spore germination protein KC [Paenibacillus eucommiae]